MFSTLIFAVPVRPFTRYDSSGSHDFPGMKNLLVWQKLTLLGAVFVLPLLAVT